MIVPPTAATATGALTPPRLFRLSTYALPSLPNATTNWEGVAPGTSTSIAPVPPRSVSLPSSEAQLIGAQKLSPDGVGPGEGGSEGENTGPGWRRMIASPPCHPCALNVLPVAIKIFVPSLERPPGDHAPPPLARVAQPITSAGLLMFTPMVHP